MAEPRDEDKTIRITLGLSIYYYGYYFGFSAAVLRRALKMPGAAGTLGSPRKASSLWGRIFETSANPRVEVAILELDSKLFQHAGVIDAARLAEKRP
jgi:hypothetical protein